MTREAAVIACCLFASGAGAEPFKRELSLQGLTFQVSSPNDSSASPLRIAVDGLRPPGAPIAREIDGTVVGAEVADLDANGSPEVYVFTQSAGSGSYGTVVAYAANRQKSVTEIALPKLSRTAARGYQGHDEFAVVEQYLVRRFPIYRPGDSNAKPTGGQRQIQYRLRAGEAGWVLRPVKTLTFAGNR